MSPPRANKQVNNDHRKLATTPETNDVKTIDGALCSMVVKVLRQDHRGNPVELEIRAKVHYAHRNFIIRIPNPQAHALRLDDKELLKITIEKIPKEA